MKKNKIWKTFDGLVVPSKLDVDEYDFCYYGGKSFNLHGERIRAYYVGITYFVLIPNKKCVNAFARLCRDSGIAKWKIKEPRIGWYIWDIDKIRFSYLPIGATEYNGLARLLLS